MAEPVLVNATLCIDTIEVPNARGGLDRVEGVIGGAAAYFAAAARLFGPVRVLGAVGEDYPEALWGKLEAMGVDWSGVVKRAGRTFRWHGRYHADLKHRDTLVVDFDPAVEALPELPEAWRDTKYVCLGVNAPENQLRLRSQFPESDPRNIPGVIPGAGVMVLDTIELYVMRHRPALIEAIGRVDGVLVNDWEAEQLTGEADPARAAQRLLGRGPRFAVVKCGGSGAVLAHGDAVWHCPTVGVQRVVDPTGAGDAFLGGMLGHLASVNAEADDVEALKQAIIRGTVAASFTIEAFSVDRIAAVTQNEFDRRLQRFA